MARPAGTKGSDTAERVRRAALSLFARHGYAAVSMRQIAAEVGVQPGALYNHFPTKQDLLKDLLVNHMRALIAAWQAQAVAGEAPDAALERFTRFHIRYHLERTEEVFISYMELRNLEPENFDAVERLRRAYEDVLTAILEAGAAAGLFEVRQPRVTTRALIAMLTGVGTWYRPGGPLSKAEIEDIYLTLVTRSVTAGPTPPGGTD
ncbi:TetR/AcrR family transcriptional regulator [Polymorphum gilvum]|uniref:Putative transcriptional regulatory protein, TetR family n=1 Tax=Polymorphum gilvum (strain LMG 25793 / CGMCC 1.9160 / SL003B-26A1) TaxID=991905 RepID=F2J262_POLGS|nr:TetR/AcrR family transcriptional regulator [Polymorphum gilvum]ADZ68821.1 Putative transcriptional regulatory protein, TetR family [Polymorphum gilvum SL003B-26A1]